MYCRFFPVNKIIFIITDQNDAACSSDTLQDNHRKRRKIMDDNLPEDTLHNITHPNGLLSNYTSRNNQK